MSAAAGNGSVVSDGPTSLRSRSLPEGAEAGADAPGEANVTFFTTAFGAVPRGGVGGVGFALLDGSSFLELPFAFAFAEAEAVAVAVPLGRPTGLVVTVVVVLPHSACIILFHAFVVI